MSIVIGTLRIDLECNTATFTEGMEKVAHISAKTANDVKRSLKTLAAVGIGMGTAIAAGTAEMVKKSVEAIVGLEHMSQAAGTTVDRLSELNYAAQRVGLPAELLVKGMEKLAKASFQAQNGNVALASVFQRLGIHVTDSNGHLKDTGVMIDEIAPKFAKMADGAGKTAIAQQLFGKGGAAMIPFLNEWGAHMDELKEKARQFGMVIGPETAMRTLKFHETLNDLKVAWTGFGLQLTAAALPALTAFADKLQEVAVRANIPELAKTFGGGLTSALTTAVGMLDFAMQHATALKRVLEGLVAIKVFNFAIPLIGQIAKGGIGNIAEGIEKLSLGLFGLKNVLPFLGGIVGWLKTAIPLLFVAGGAADVFTSGLAAIGGPVTLAVLAIGGLSAALYAYRDAAFQAYGATYTWGDAFRAAFFMEGFVGNEEGLKRAKARRLSQSFVGPIDDRPKKRAELEQPDTSGLGVPKKDVFGELIAKLKLATEAQNKYIAVLHGTPEEIQKVAIAEKADAEILKITNELIDQHTLKKGQKLALDKQEEVRANVAAEMNAKAAHEYLSGLVDQQNAAKLATTQALNLAKAQLEGDEAVRRAAIDNEILALSLNKLGAGSAMAKDELATLRDMLSGKSSAAFVEGTNREIRSLQDELAVREILNSAIIQGVEAQRLNAIAADTYKINKQLEDPNLSDKERKALEDHRQGIINLAKAKNEAADLERARSLLSPIEAWAQDTAALNLAVKALAKMQDGMISQGQAAMVAAQLQELFNKAVDGTVNQLLRLNSLKAGVQAFFQDMQKETKKTAAIVYEALHSAFDRLSDELTNLVTGAKTNFAKMFEDIGRQMVKAEIQKGLQTVLAKIGGKLFPGIVKKDGQTETSAFFVQVVGGVVPGQGQSTPPTTPQSGSLPGLTNSLGSILGALRKGPGWLSTVLGAVGGLFGMKGGGSSGGGGESVTSSISFGGEEAGGGTVSPDQAYLVGERGPELLMGASGYIASNSASQRMLSGNVSNHYYTIDARGTDPVLTEQRTRAAIIAAHNSAVGNSMLVSQEHLKRTPQR